MKGKTMALDNQRLFKFLAACVLACTVSALRADNVGLPDLPPTAAPVPLDASAVVQTQPDMGKMQAQIKDLLDQEHSIDQNENALNHAIDRVLNATGLHLGGVAVVQSENMLVLPYDPLLEFKNAHGLPTQFNLNGAVGAQRIWPTIGYFDLDLTAKPTSELSAEVVYRMEKVFGAFWGQGDLAGVRWFNIHGDTPIGFDLGMFHYQNTPLTFWVPQDEYAFEPEVLAMKRAEGRSDAQIQDQSFPLGGAKADTTLLLFDHLDLDLTTLGLRTAVAGNSNSPLGFGVTFPYDQYWIGGTARFSGETDKAFSLGFTYLNMQESVDTALTTQIVTPQYSEVMGSDFKLTMAGGKVVLHGEGAYSKYNPAYGTGQVLSWTAGGAGNIILDVKTDSTTLSLHGLYVDQQYINYAAQTRDEDTVYNFAGFEPTGNNLFNPYNDTYNLANQSNVYFSTYNNVIFATNQGPNNGLVLSNGSQPGGLYLAPSPLNLSTPEGYATPDRAGFGGDLKGKYFGTGFFQPRLFGSLYMEPEISYQVPVEVGRRTYSKGGAGAVLDFAALGGIPLKISAGVVVEDTQSNSFVAFTSTRVAYDMDYEAFKNIHLLAGFQHVDMNGGEFWDYGAGPVYEWQNYTYDNYVAGIDWHLSKASDVFLTYSFDQFQNIDYGNAALAAAQPHLDIYSANAQTQEFEAKLRVEF